MEMEKNMNHKYGITKYIIIHFLILLFVSILEGCVNIDFYVVKEIVKEIDKKLLLGDLIKCYDYFEDDAVFQYGTLEIPYLEALSNYDAKRKSDAEFYSKIYIFSSNDIFYEEKYIIVRFIAWFTIEHGCSYEGSGEIIFQKNGFLSWKIIKIRSYPDWEIEGFEKVFFK